MQFQSFLEDPQYKDQHELQATMIRTFGKVAPHAEPHFRDEGKYDSLSFIINLTRNKYVQSKVVSGKKSSYKHDA